MEDPVMNKVEAWKSEKHGFDVWPDVEDHAKHGTPMAEIAEADLERMKWRSEERRVGKECVP